jgi:tetratricopeptide (TPR) repeat protein
MYALFLAAALSLAEPTGSSAAVAQASLVPAPATIRVLPPELRQRLHAEVLSTPASQQRRLEQVLHFILDEDALGVAYDQGATHSVEQTYATRKANCLSFTLLFLAIAREAGLEVRAQEIEDTLSWQQEQSTIYRNNHINAGVRINHRSYTVDSSGDTLVAGGHPVGISERRLLAHYYNNLAMEQLARADIDAGLQLIDAAIATDSNYAPLWSNAGVLHLHKGDLAAARRAYLKALEIDPDEDSALFNMISLSQRVRDTAQETEFRRRLARVQQRDPLHHFMQGMDYERSGDYLQAIEHYRRAIRLYPGEHRFHSALARVYLKAGNPRSAGKALKRAQALTDGATRAAYRAQLQALGSSSN